MNGLEGLPTKTLQLLWDNIHKEDGLIVDDLTDAYGKHCALGCTHPYIGEINKKIVLMGYPDTGPGLELGLQCVTGISSRIWIIIHEENDSFEGTPADRRVHMLQFLGKELMSRNDLEAGFKEKVESVA